MTNYNSEKNLLKKVARNLTIAGLALIVTGCASLQNSFTQDPTERNTKIVEEYERQKEEDKRLGIERKPSKYIGLPIYSQ